MYHLNTLFNKEIHLLNFKKLWALQNTEAHYWNKQLFWHKTYWKISVKINNKKSSFKTFETLSPKFLN